ncbi:MAG: DUF3822 family protein [Vicingaceae bacterium]
MSDSQSRLLPSRNYTDSFYTASKNTSKFLSLQVGKDGMSYAILSPTDNTVELTREFIFDSVNSNADLLADIRGIVENDPALMGPFFHTSIGFYQGKSTLIPEALFEAGMEESYLNFTEDSDVERYFFSNKLVNLRSRNVFSVDKALCDYLQSCYPTPLFLHSSTPLIDVFALQEKRNSGRRCFIHVQYSHFEILCFEKGELRFYNSFDYTTAEDLLYYVLFVFEQLDLNQESEPISVFGEIDQYGTIADLLKRYLGVVEFGNRIDMLSYSPALDAVPKHYYINLYQQFLCE